MARPTDWRGTTAGGALSGLTAVFFIMLPDITLTYFTGALAASVLTYTLVSGLFRRGPAVLTGAVVLLCAIVLFFVFNDQISDLKPGPELEIRRIQVTPKSGGGATMSLFMGNSSSVPIRSMAYDAIAVVSAREGKGAVIDLAPAVVSLVSSVQSSPFLEEEKDQPLMGIFDVRYDIDLPDQEWSLRRGNHVYVLMFSEYSPHKNAWRHWVTSRCLEVMQEIPDQPITLTEMRTCTGFNIYIAGNGWSLRKKLGGALGVSKS